MWCLTGKGEAQAFGRNETTGMSWIKRHDQYEDAPKAAEEEGAYR